MPFKSDAQRKWMWATHPEMAKEWSKKTPKGKKLPTRVNEDTVNKWIKRANQSAKMAGQSIRNFTKHSTTGQKITAGSTIVGATYGGIRRGRRAWRQYKGKPGRLRRTAKEAAKGTFGGAIGGAITGHGVGSAWDFMMGNTRVPFSQRGEDINVVITNLLQEDNAPKGDYLSRLGAVGNRIKRWLQKHKSIAALSLSNPKLPKVKGIKGLPISGFFRKYRVRRYRNILWHRHRVEIYKEAKRAVDSVLKHKDLVNELITDIRNNYSGFSVPEPIVRDLSKQLIKDSKKIFVNDEYPGSEWSKMSITNWGIWVVYYSAYLAVNSGFSFVDALQIILSNAYEDYVYNKHEEDKSKYVY